MKNVVNFIQKPNVPSVSYSSEKAISYGPSSITPSM